MTSRKLMTLVYVRKSSEILLGLKKRGFGEGKWDGFGGKVEPNETIEQGAIRELHEECGLTAIEMKKIGYLEFEFEGNPTLLEVHVFETFKYQGKLIESDEMRPEWFDVKNIPYDKMWPDEEYWYPWMLRGEPFKGYFLYRGLDHIVKHELKKLDLQHLNN